MSAIAELTQEQQLAFARAHYLCGPKGDDALNDLYEGVLLSAILDKVSVSPVNSGALTNRSGTIAVIGTAQDAAVENSARKYLLFQNLDTNDMWINIGANASAAAGSLKIPAGGSAVWESGYIPTGRLSVFSAVALGSYTCKEA